MNAVESSFTALSRTAALVLAGLLVPGFGLTTIAHSQNAESQNRLEGTWRVQITVTDCQNPNVVLRSFPSRLSYAKGGTFTATTGGQLPSLSTANLGVWKHVDGHTYRAVSEAFVFSPAGAWTSIQRFTRLIEVSLDGKTYTDVVALEILDTSGQVIGTGCATSVANRME